jgi:peptidoglycan/LPS O-acetylase OafA/YrhL
MSAVMRQDGFAGGASRSMSTTLDIARGVSALAVFSAHLVACFLFRYIGDENPASIGLCFIAQYAVLVFFLLSGYLITSTIVANIKRFGGLDMIDYLSSRIARLYPPLIASIAITVAGYWIVQTFCLPGGCSTYGLPGDLWRPREYFELSSSDVAQALAMRGGLINPNGALWSLYVEFSLYIVAMGVAGAITWRNHAYLIGLLIAGLGVVYGLKVNEHFAFFALVWGVGSAFVLVRGLAWVTILTTLVGLSVFAFYGPGIVSVESFDTPALVFRLCACSVIAMGLFSFPAWSTRLSSAIGTTALFSYTLYIVHAPLLLLVLSLTQNWIGYSPLRSVAVAVTTFFAILTISILLARIVEQPKFFKRIILSAFLR